MASGFYAANFLAPLLLEGPASCSSSRMIPSILSYSSRRSLSCYLFCEHDDMVLFILVSAQARLPREAHTLPNQYNGTKMTHVSPFLQLVSARFKLYVVLGFGPPLLFPLPESGDKLSAAPAVEHKMYEVIQSTYARCLLKAVALVLTFCHFHRNQLLPCQTWALFHYFELNRFYPALHLIRNQ